MIYINFIYFYDHNLIKVLGTFIYKNEIFKFKKFTNKNITKKYLRWINNKELMKYSRQRHHTSNKSTVKRYIKSMSNNWFLAVSIKKNKSFRHIGNISVYFDDKDMSASISILIGSVDFRNLGLGKVIWQEIMKRLSNFKEIKLIKAGTFYKNIPMIKIFKFNNMKLSKKKSYVYAKKII